MSDGFNTLVDRIHEGRLDEEELAGFEREDNIFPEMDYNIYSRHYRVKRRRGAGEEDRPLKILMLSWEFPPRTVGGLARHVYDLSRALARLGVSVHVVTCPAQGTPRYQFVEGVHVHRVDQARLTSREFMEWIQQLNEAMVEVAGELVFPGPLIWFTPMTGWWRMLPLSCGISTSCPWWQQSTPRSTEGTGVFTTNFNAASTKWRRVLPPGPRG